jgi:hypothetical protein
MQYNNNRTPPNAREMRGFLEPNAIGISGKNNNAVKKRTRE